jgi:DNA-binding FadR family transcriptional regulator
MRSNVKRMPQLRRTTLSQSIASALLDSIEEGRYRPGDLLPTERELVIEFDAGRNTVREAVQALVALGVIDVRPGVGARVVEVRRSEAAKNVAVASRISDAAVVDLIEFRATVEVDIAKRAAERSNSESLANIRDALAAFEVAVRTATGIAAADIEFHRAVAAASDNSVFMTTLDAVSDLLTATRSEAAKAPGAPEMAIVQHQAILEAIERSDSDGAGLAARDHVDRGTWALLVARGHIGVDDGPDEVKEALITLRTVDRASATRRARQ